MYLFFQVWLKSMITKKGTEVVFGVGIWHMGRWCSITCPHIQPKNESPDAQMEQQSVHMLKMKEDRLRERLLHIETAAPNSCCYTLWCSVEMWAGLLIELLLASSLMSHCSFHDPLLKEEGVWCNPTGLISGPETRWFSNLSKKTEQTLTNVLYQSQ